LKGDRALLLKAFLYSLPFALFVFLRVALSFRQSTDQGVVSVQIVLSVLIGMSLTVPVGWLVFVTPPLLRNHSLRKMYPGSLVLSGRWTESFAVAMTQPEFFASLPKNFNTYSAVAEEVGLSIWSGAHRPRRAALIQWDQVSYLSLGGETSRGRTFATIDVHLRSPGATFGLGVSQDPTRLGIPRRGELIELVGRLQNTFLNRASPA